MDFSKRLLTQSQIRNIFRIVGKFQCCHKNKVGAETFIQEKGRIDFSTNLKNYSNLILQEQNRGNFSCSITKKKFCMRATISCNYSAEYYQYQMTDFYIRKWHQLGEIIEKNGKNVADIVTLFPRLTTFHIRMYYPVQSVTRLFWSSLDMK